MIPKNKTEDLLLHIANKDDTNKEHKDRLIKHCAYPSKRNHSIASVCQTCLPPDARPEFVEYILNSLNARYTVTIYTVYPGTPLNNDDGSPKFEDGERETSAAGHMWLQIKKINKDGIEEYDSSYGFAPIETAMKGPGKIITKDTVHYENPYYNRTMEITKQQYNKIYEFSSEAEERKSDKYFNLMYNGLTNSCINFTWKALSHAGIKPTLALNDRSIYNIEHKSAGEFKSDIKVINNIPHVKSITAPFPDSELNTEKYNEIPPIRADDILSNGVYVWTERVEAGHSYISIHKDNNLNVFTYGRFGRTGTGGVSGDGILIYLQGEDARNYFRHELYKMNARVFFIGDADIEKTYQHFYYLWEKGSKPTWLPKSAGDATKAHGRIIDVYDLSSSNCTTHTVHGLKTGGSKIFNTSYTPIRTQYPINREESFVIPLSLENYLDSKKNDFSSLTIVEMTDLFKDKYPNINNVKEGEKGIKQSGYESGTQSLSTIGSLGISFEESGGIFGSTFDAEITNED